MKKLLPPLLFCLLLLACSDEKSAKPKGIASGKTTVGNFDYVFFIKNNGTTPQPGDSIFFHADIKRFGELVATSRTLGRAKDMIFPQEYLGDPQPLIEGLRLMSPGDSLNIQMTMNNDSTNVLSYDLKMERIQKN